MSHVLFESPLKLIIGELIIALVCIGWLRYSARPAGRILGGFVGISLGLLLMQALVVTDAEKLRAIVRDMAEAVDFGELDRLRAHLAEDFEAQNLGPDSFIRHVYQQLETYQVDEVRVLGVDLRVDSDTANMEFTARARVGTRDYGMQPHLSRWRLSFRQDSPEWKVIRVEHLGSPGAESGGIVPGFPVRPGA